MSASRVDLSVAERLRLLRIYLSNLPLPPLTAANGSRYGFDSFGLSDVDVEDMGEVGAVNHELEVRIGMRAHGLNFTESGPGLVSVVTVLEEYLALHPEDALLVKWLDDLLHAATTYYTSHRLSLPKSMPQRLAALDESQRVTTFEDEEFHDLPEPSGSKSSGVQTSDVLIKATRLATRLSDGEKRFRCVASRKCKTSWAPQYAKEGGLPSRNRKRYLKHTKNCPNVPPSLTLAAVNALAGPDLDEGAPNAGDGSSVAVGSKRRREDDVGQPTQSKIAKTSHLPPTSLDVMVQGKESKRKVKDNRDHKFTLFVACNLVPPNVFETKESDNWIASLTTWKTPSASSICEAHIPAEAARVFRINLAHLQNARNLTLSFDGGKIRNRASFYSVHVTDSGNPKRTILLDLDDASHVRHTAAYILELADKWINLIGPWRFIAVTSDNTGNTRKSRTQICAAYPHILNLKDCCHAMSLAVGDISKLEAFKVLVSNMRVILKFMAQTYLAPEFKHIRILLGIARGLEQIVQTRFGSLAWAALSLRRNLPALRKLVAKCGDEFDFNGKKALLTAGDSRSLRFELELTKFVAVTEPIARAIKCLESPNTNPADVCTFWFAVVAHYNRLLKSDALEISDETKDTIREIVKSRFVDAIINAPKNVYLTAFYLDPRNRDAPIWANTNPLQPPEPRIRIAVENRGGMLTARQPIGPSAKTHDGIYDALVMMLQDIYGKASTIQQLMERAPEFNGMPPDIATETLKAEYDAYKAREEPFDERFCKDDTPAKWWERVQASVQGVCVLSVLASRLFASTATSMADERTASQVTMLNSAHRAGLSLGTIKEMIQIKQYHRQTDSNYAPSVSKWRAVSDVLSKRTSTSAKELDQALSPSGEIIDLDDDNTVTPDYDDGLDEDLGEDEPVGRKEPNKLDTLIDSVGIDFGSPILLDVLDETPAGTSKQTPVPAKPSARATSYTADAWNNAESFDWKAAASRK